MSYAVVCFLDECEGESEVVQEVPLSWLRNENTICMWPPTNYSHHIINGTPPMVSWKVCRIRCDRICDSLSEARKKCTNETSSEEERGRGQRRRFPSKHLADGHRGQCNSPPMPQHPTDTDYHIQEIGVVPQHIERVIDRASQFSQPSSSRTSNVPIKESSLVHQVRHQGNHDSITNERLMVIERKIDNLADIIGTILVMINGLKDTKKTEPMDPEIKAKFPFLTIESLTEFNATVESDSEIKKKVVRYFSSIGGLSSKDFHNRAMSKMITNSLAMTCSWKGFKNNHKLGDILIIQCLYEAITADYPLTLKEFEILTRDWLRHAKQRSHRQERR